MFREEDYRKLEPSEKVPLSKAQDPENLEDDEDADELWDMTDVGTDPDDSEEDMEDNEPEEEEPDEVYWDELSPDEEDEEDEEDDEENGGDIVIRFRPWMIPVFAGLVVVAILICIPLWGLSHREPQTATLTPVTLPAQENRPVVIEQPTEPVAEATTEPAVEATTEPEATAEPTASPELPEEPISGDASMAFTEVNDRVTAKDVTNLRSLPSTETSSVVGKLKNGESLPRTGRNDDTGWSRLEYNGQIVYAVSAFLTDDLDYQTPVAQTDPNRVSTQDGRLIVFVNCDDYITPKDVINLRTEPSTTEGESTVRTQVRAGTNLHRTGYSEAAGWSRVEYNGEVLYAVTTYVVSGTAPEAAAAPEAENAPEAAAAPEAQQEAEAQPQAEAAQE